MTRVSDVDGFAKAVADGGGLPFIALSVMRQDQVQTLLTKTKELLGDQPWGVGILGFMPLELRQAQLLILRSSGQSYQEIAASLGVSVTSIGTLLNRAEAEFEKRYRAAYPEGG